MKTGDSVKRADICRRVSVWVVLGVCGWLCGLCWTAKAAAGQIPVQTGEMKLVLEKGSSGVRVVSLTDVGTGQELLAPHPAALFSLDLRDAKAKRSRKLTATSGWRTVEVSDMNGLGQRVLILSFKRPNDSSLKGIGVDVVLAVDGANSALVWDLKVTNKNKRWGLWKVTFPQVAIRYLGAGSKVFMPYTSGVEWSDLWRINKRRGGNYPTGWTCMQYMAAYNGAGTTGFYIGMHDPHGSLKYIFAQGLGSQRAVAFRYDHPAPDMGVPGVDFELPGQARWQLLRGDWFDASMIYRQWVSHHAKWWPKLGPDGRENTPKWMRELPVWVKDFGAAWRCVPQVRDFAEKVQVPVGFHWYYWHHNSFDNDYPHYFPPKAGFSTAIEELKRAGVYVTPYVNGRLWDTRDRGMEDWQFTKIALPATTKDKNGHPYVRSFRSKEADGSPVKLAIMCPATQLWRSTVKNIVLKLMDEYGVNGVYLDQVASATPRLCFDSSHGHPLGGGHWWAQGYWQMLDSIRANMPANCILTAEDNAETYVKWLDGYLTWHWQRQGMVPAFSAVYGGAVQLFGRVYRGGPSQDLANRMKTAQQLVFGEQLGWFEPELVERPDCGPFILDCIALRWRLRRYFYAGRMARPPKLIGNIPTVTADWRWKENWMITTSAVMTGAWWFPEKNKTVLIFANVSDKSLSARVRLDTKQYHLRGGKFLVTKIGPDGQQSSFVAKPGEEFRAYFGPRSVFAWEVVAVQERGRGRR